MTNCTKNIRPPLIIFLMGPTASGKTNLAMKLKQRLPIEIISVDSGLIYREMDIGTSKPNYKELKYAPHHLINIRDPSEYYSAANFFYDAGKKIQQIILRKNIPILVGGTMLYFNILSRGLCELPSADQKIRFNIKNTAKIMGWKYMYEKLKKIDPKSTKKIHPNDHYRITRALEIFLISGTPSTKLKTKTKHILNYKIYKLAIIPNDIYFLYKNIQQRFQNMLSCGFKNEVIRLLLRGDLNKNMPSMHCIGYKQMWKYLHQEINYNDMINQTIHATKQLIKHQMTWLKKYKKITLINSINNIEIFNTSMNFITNEIKKYKKLH